MTFWQFAFKNVSRNSKAYFAYFVSSAFSIMVFFSFTVYAYHPRLQSVQSFQERDPLMNLASTAQLVIVMFSFFFLLYSIGTFLNVRKQQFGILTILGISQRQLKRLLFTENMIIGILSIFIGIQGGLVFSNFFLLVTSKLTSAKGLYLYWPTEAIIVTTVTFIILFLIVSTFTPMFIRTRKTAHLIKGNKKMPAEKRPSILISLFALICLGLCYYIAGYPRGYVTEKNVQNGSVFFIMLSILPLVIVGTYLFFSQTFLLFIYILKKRRKFYLKQINMLWISDLVSRTRSNINVLFIVSMLSALAFTIIIGLFAANNNTKASVLERYPVPFTYTSEGDNSLEQKHISTIETELTTNNFLYKKYKFTVLKDTASKEDIMLMKMSDYNAIAKQLKRPEITIDSTEVYIISRHSPELLDLVSNPFAKQNTITLGSNKKEFHIKGFINKGIEPSFAFPHLAVVQDYVFDNMIPHIETTVIYNYFVENWENAIVPTKNMLRVISGDAREFYEKHTEENAQVPFFIHTATDELIYGKGNAVAQFFIWAFLGFIFFIGAASVLYFRMYNDLTTERQKYITITKLGLTESEMFRSATIQLGILFFVPYIVAGVHTLFAVKFLQSMFSFSLLKETCIVLTFFGIIEIIFFFLIRSLYINKLSQHIKI
ncbi:TPA: FtsX-like permease family protein [Bacillus thuringiensis]|jgi:putative ABC transport system permease protein|uniref:ABC transporter permease n=4 Tax=Bacillus cereus group TaxID=86661 RepID=A0A9X6ZFU3_BACCE|nr:MULTISPECIES: ABC transporter permease [Bacillus]OUB07049.1 ABC transporter permease [Bacillus thuringiensis serovar yunnanensis]WIK95444.1 ABC transporter permease [Bacillus bombysepticus]BCA33897.1 ABC transporter permease [Bacillus wiedmannii]AGE80727.1 ABC transporter, permease component [Bacillus thuringiensis serovar kurstaki str. HD73]AHZ53680.1 ABC transporter permease [Bacillus thuringiensis serovar kurstaki str. YBT-1520]